MMHHQGVGLEIVSGKDRALNCSGEGFSKVAASEMGSHLLSKQRACSISLIV
jgi:hypothetical protein